MGRANKQWYHLIWCNFQKIVNLFVFWKSTVKWLSLNQASTKSWWIDPQCIHMHSSIFWPNLQVLSLYCLHPLEATYPNIIKLEPCASRLTFGWKQSKITKKVDEIILSLKRGSFSQKHKKINSNLFKFILKLLGLL